MTSKRSVSQRQDTNNNTWIIKHNLSDCLTDTVYDADIAIGAGGTILKNSIKTEIIEYRDSDAGRFRQFKV